MKIINAKRLMVMTLMCSALLGTVAYINKDGHKNPPPNLTYRFPLEERENHSGSPDNPHTSPDGYEAREIIPATPGDQYSDIPGNPDLGDYNPPNYPYFENDENPYSPYYGNGEGPNNYPNYENQDENPFGFNDNPLERLPTDDI